MVDTKQDALTAMEETEAVTAAVPEAPYEPALSNEVEIAIFKEGAAIIAVVQMERNNMTEHFIRQYGEPEYCTELLDEPIDLLDDTAVTLLVNDFSVNYRAQEQKKRFNVLRDNFKGVDGAEGTLVVLEHAAKYALAMSNSKEISQEHYGYMDLYIKAAGAVGGRGSN